MKYYFFIPLLLQKLIWIPTRLTLSVFGNLSIRGLENLNEITGNVIFAANHAGEIDPFLIPASLPFWSRFSPLFYATREKSFYDTNGWRKHLFGGFFINAWGGYGVKVGLNNYEESLVEHIHIGQDGGSFCIFPEGGITPDGNLRQGKGGVAYLAARTGMAIIPVAFSGTYKTSVSDFFCRKRKIIVSFGKPIYQEELKAKIVNRDSLGLHVYSEEAHYIMEEIRKLMITHDVIIKSSNK